MAEDLVYLRIKREGEKWRLGNYQCKGYSFLLVLKYSIMEEERRPKGPAHHCHNYSALLKFPCKDSGIREHT